MDKVKGLKMTPNGKPVLGQFGSLKERKDVLFMRRGEKFPGDLYLAEHHIIFSMQIPGEPDVKPQTRQVWISYPMIAHCTYRPMPSITRQQSSIRLRCRDFTFVAFQFEDESEGRDAYETIKALTCLPPDLTRLHAFSYRPPPEEAKIQGWEIYDARREFRRMGIGPKEADKGWRLSDINHDYVYSATYPAVIVVPSSVSDNVLKHGGSYRSKVRIPALSYLHPVNNCSITRSSQPMVGLMKNKRNPQDERLVAAIFSNSRPPTNTPSLQTSTSAGFDEGQTRLSMQSSQMTELAFESQRDPTESREPSLHHHRSEPDIRSAKIYGAQQRNLIVDARPFINARVNQAAGMGSENMDYYKDATINFLGIDNIHVMRDSLSKVVDAISHSDYTKLAPDQGILTKSKWLHYIARVLKGAELVARQIGVNHSHVLIHCSDGWDRTSQISALSQLCLDPYYRTIEGFVVLVEKDWLSFGHMFRRRTGPLGSEKWFEIENERVGGREGQNGGQPATNAIENAFLKAQGFFSKKNDSRENLDIDGDGTNSVESSPQQSRSHVSKHDPFATKPSETSPIFHQFLDATWQLLHQHPTRFEFNERFLRRLLYQLYACQYGTFLFDCERERVEQKAAQRTRSVWDYFLSRKAQFINERYDPEIDDKVIGKERLIFPDPRKVRWWPEVFGRTDEEMNGTVAAPAASLPKDDEPVVTGIENDDVAVGTAVNGSSLANLESNNPFAGSAEKLSSSFSSLGFGRSAPTSRPRTPIGDRLRESSGEDEVQSSPVVRRNELSMQTFARDSAFKE